MVHGFAYLCDHRLALDLRNLEYGAVSGPDVQHDAEGNLRILADDRSAFQRKQHGRILRIVQRTHLVSRPILAPFPGTYWKKTNENMIGLIRAFDKEEIPLVAGFDWAYDLTPLCEQPIAAEGIGYVTHPYAKQTASHPPPPKWEEDFGFAADHYPIIATEIGFTNSQTVPKSANNDYGNLSSPNYLEGRRGISWVAWDHDPERHLQLLKSWDYSLTGSGEFFKEAMHRDIARAKRLARNYAGLMTGGNQLICREIFNSSSVNGLPHSEQIWRGDPIRQYPHSGQYGPGFTGSGFT